MRLIAHKAQPRRIQMAALGRELLNLPTLSTDWKNFIRSMMRDAYSPWFMLFVAFALPLLPLLGRKYRLPDIEDVNTQIMLDKFIDCHGVATSAANPFCAVIVGLEIGVMTAVLYPFGGWQKKSRKAHNQAVLNVETISMRRVLARAA